MASHLGVTASSNEDDPHNPHPDGEPLTVVAIDYGTKTFSACWGQRHTDKPTEVADRVFHFPDEQSTLGEMVAAWHEGEFHFGTPLIRNTTRDVSPVPAEKLITCFKLLLYDSYRHCERVQRVRLQLRAARKTFEDLLCETMRAIWTGICRDAEERGLNLEPRNTIVYFTVPIFVTAKTTSMMASAARAAGLPPTQFVLEPLCAGAAILAALIGDRNAAAAYAPYRGCHVQVIDMGGATTDCVGLRMPDSVEDVKHNRLDVLSADGIDCGSTDVDKDGMRYLENEIESRAGGMPALEETLCLSKGAILANALSEFQVMKKDTKNSQTLRLHANRFVEQQTQAFEISAPLMRSFYEPHVQRIIACAEANLTPRMKHIIITGGLAENEYVFNRLLKHFATRGIFVKKPIVRHIEAPVAKGALMVDDRLNQKLKRSQHSVGLVFFADDAQKHLHPDAYDKNGKPRKNVAFYDPVYTAERGQRSYTVHNRIKWLIYKGDKADTTGHFVGSEEPGEIQQFFLPLQKTMIVGHTCILTTKPKDDLRQHEPARTQKGSYYKGFQAHQIRTTLTPEFIERCRKAGRVIRNKACGNREWVELCTAVNVRYNNFFLDIKIRFVSPETFKIRGEEDWLRHVTLDYDPGDWEEISDALTDTTVINSEALNSMKARVATGFADSPLAMAEYPTPSTSHDTPPESQYRQMAQSPETTEQLVDDALKALAELGDEGTERPRAKRGRPRKSASSASSTRQSKRRQI